MDSIDKLIIKKPDLIEEEDWHICREQLEKKKSDLLDYIEEDDSRFPGINDSSVDMLMDALRSRLS